MEDFSEKERNILKDIMSSLVLAEENDIADVIEDFIRRFDDKVFITYLGVLAKWSLAYHIPRFNEISTLGCFGCVGASRFRLWGCQIYGNIKGVCPIGWDTCSILVHAYQDEDILIFNDGIVDFLDAVLHKMGRGMDSNRNWLLKTALDYSNTENLKE